MRHPGIGSLSLCRGGAKNYGYLTHKGKTECKIRGFSLNYEPNKVLNYQTMKKEYSVANRRAITRGKANDY